MESYYQSQGSYHFSSLDRDQNEVLVVLNLDHLFLAFFFNSSGNYNHKPL